MPRSQDYIRADFAGFDQQFSLIKEQVTANTAGSPPIWPHIPAEEAAKLTAAWEDWHPKHIAAENPERTKSDVRERQDARKRTEPVLRNFCPRFFYDAPQYVTPAQLESMRLPVRDTTKSPIGKPAVRVVIEVEPSKTRTHLLRWHVDEDESTALPYGTNGWVLVYKILEQGEAVPTDPDEFGHSVLVTRNPFTVEHKSGTEGKRVAYCGAFQNGKGEKGDWGEIVVAVCP
jgi:hypothetical protein